MRFSSFLNILSPKQKASFLVGAVLEKTKTKLAGYEGLRIYKNLLIEIEKKGFELKFNSNELILSKAGQEISLRKNSSDMDVFKQVFLRDEYLPLMDSALANKVSVTTIIDAGSNVGLTSIKFLERFTNARVICLEPDPGNFKQLQFNLKNYSNRTTLLHMALWHREESLYLNAGFRDGKEWARSVDTKEQGEPVQGSSMSTIMQQHGLTAIDILKIDIEGSEAAIFKEGNDLSFLDVTRVIALEIHDEFNCRETIYDILRKKGFVIFNAVELTMGVNRNLVGR
ncbi:FkbM family methyltransferase [Mucilaginibacter sp.]|uniref:FkbM family methyltransferase n=1 Tax=Mucilaginibacter sp. TaxID=1882438 RepID=UPI00326600E5